MRNRHGFTLLEIIISITVLLFIMGAAVQFLRRQSNLVSSTTHQMDALQNAEFAATQIERELREAGVGVADIQPMIVQIDSEAITFNGNLVSIDTGDVRAVYQSKDADPNAVRAMYVSENRPLPNTNGSHNYPDTTYLAAKGIESGAETISYFLRPDSANTAQANRYLLFRRVNGLAPTLIARDIVKDKRDTIPFFTYFTSDTLNRLVPVARTRLPAFHIKVHGSVADTASSALTDSIRVVRVHFTTLAVETKAGKDSLKIRSVENRVRLMNSGLLQFSDCGQRPLAVATPTVATTSSGVTPQTVTITWTRSGDDGQGEKDIERYAIFRRAAAATVNGDPIASIPSKLGTTTYSFIDTFVQPNTSYVYGISAQDCTPNLSDITLSAPITTSP